MDNILIRPASYDRFFRCSVVIQILICILLLMIVVKQAINFYLKNHIPFIIIDQTVQKRDEQTGVTIKNNENNNLNNENNLRPSATQQQVIQVVSPRESHMKTSKNSLKPKHPSTASLTNPITNANNGANSMKASKTAIQNQPQLKQPATTQLSAQRESITFKLSLHLQNFIFKLPIISIMIINIMLLTSYQFLVIMSYVGITVMILAELVGDRWGKLGIILEICIAGIVIAGYINAYVTPRIPYK